MARFIAGVVAAMLLLTGGLLWWQGRADSGKPFPQPQPALPAMAEELPKGDETLVGAAPPMPAEAQPQDKEARRFARYDRDRNGIISRVEMLSSRTKDFKKLDTDGNNLLSFEEWSVATAERFDKADADHDARLTPSEFATTAPKRTAKPRCKC